MLVKATVEEERVVARRVANDVRLPSRLGAKDETHQVVGETITFQSPSIRRVRSTRTRTLDTRQARCSVSPTVSPMGIRQFYGNPAVPQGNPVFSKHGFQGVLVCERDGLVVKQQLYMVVFTVSQYRAWTQVKQQMLSRIGLLCNEHDVWQFLQKMEEI